MEKRKKAELETELDDAHDLLDNVGVPRALPGANGRVSTLTERLQWACNEALGEYVRSRTGKRLKHLEQAARHLQTLASLYETHNGPYGGSQTAPWEAVKWARENL